MALRNISLNTKFILIVITFFSIPQFIKCDTEVLNNTNFIPVHYNVKIELDFHRNFLFGECNITFNITREIVNISIPSVNFGILQINIIDVKNEEENEIIINVRKFSFINETQIYIDFSYLSVDVLVPGAYILQILYVRNILDNTNFNGSLYNEEIGINGLTKTGIEILKPQQIFPCWHKFETTFTISIKHSNVFNVISNMIIKTTERKKNSNMMWTHFTKSPSMSIQHLTIVITSFATVSSIEFASPNVTVWCRGHTRANLALAQIILSNMVSRLIKNKVSTKIKKVDYVAYWDTQHSNIATWGLILHREEDVIYDNKRDSTARKIEVANLLASQTLSVWYNSLAWPIEGFTTYFGADILSQMKDLDYMEHLYAVQIQQESLRFDNPSNSRKDFEVHRKVDKANEIYPYYLKSSILWRILRHFLKEDVFWYVISIYTMRHKQSSEAKFADLWVYVQNKLNEQIEYVSFDVQNFINMWEDKNYYPILYVEQNISSVQLLFSYLSSNSVDGDKDPLRVFVTYVLDITGTDYTKHFWMTPRQSRIFKNYDLSNVIIVNNEQQGYYRVHYDDENWRKISTYLISNHANVHDLDLAQIVDDAFYFLINGQLGATVFWNIAHFLSNSTSFIAWYPMFKAFEYMACMYNIDSLPSIKPKMEHIASTILKQIGYDEKQQEADLIMCLREEAAKWACLLGNSECRTAATARLIKDIKHFTEDNRYTWKEWKYCKGLMLANETVWRDTYSMLQNWKSDIRILEYLTCCNDIFFIKTYLNQTTVETDEALFPMIHNRVKIILLTIAKHAKKHTVLDFITLRLESKQLSLTGNWQRDKIVVLIIIITNLNSRPLLQKISRFVKDHINETQIADAIAKKIRKRNLEIARHITNAGTLLI